jgi:hypothetical protein
LLHGTFITASLANLLWWLQQFFNLKFWIPTGISRRDVTLTDEIALIEKLKTGLLKRKAGHNDYRGTGG